MHVKKEGPVLRQVPMTRPPRSQVAIPGRHVRPRGLLRCEMCGAEVIATHCKRICPSCGFMTGCSEGL